MTCGMFHTILKHYITSIYVSLSVMPHFAQNVERSVTTLAKDPHGDVDEPQFIDASKLVSKHTLNSDHNTWFISPVVTSFSKEDLQCQLR